MANSILLFLPILFLIVAGVPNPADNSKPLRPVGPIIRTEETDKNAEETQINAGKPKPVDKNYPFFVSIRNEEGLLCGGSIISNKWIITTAHSIDDKYGITGYYINAGSKYYNKEGVRTNVKNRIIHPNYNKITYENDIALIELESPLTFNENIAAIPLVTKGDFTGLTHTFTAWGLLQDGSIAPIAYHVNNTVISDSDCTAAYAGTTIFKSELMICNAAGPSGGNNCPDDSGGPGFINDNGINKLFCLASFDSPNCGDAKPGVNTRISAYVQWIFSVTKLQFS